MNEFISLSLENFNSLVEIDEDQTFGDSSKDNDYLPMSLDNFREHPKFDILESIIFGMLHKEGSENENELDENANLENIGCLRSRFGTPNGVYIATIALVDDKPACVFGNSGDDENPRNVVFIRSEPRKKGGGFKYYIGDCQFSFGWDDSQKRIVKAITVSIDDEMFSIDCLIKWGDEISREPQRVSLIKSLDDLADNLKNANSGGSLSLKLSEVCNDDLASQALVKLPLTLQVIGWDAPFTPPVGDDGKAKNWQSINLHIEPIPYGILKNEIVENVSKIQVYSNSQAGSLCNPETRLRCAITNSFGGKVVVKVSTLGKRYEKDGKVNYTNPSHNLYRFPSKDVGLRVKYDKALAILNVLMQDRKFVDILNKDVATALSLILKKVEESQETPKTLSPATTTTVTATKKRELAAVTVPATVVEDDEDDEDDEDEYCV